MIGLINFFKLLGLVILYALPYYLAIIFCVSILLFGIADLFSVKQDRPLSVVKNWNNKQKNNNLVELGLNEANKKSRTGSNNLINVKKLYCSTQWENLLNFIYNIFLKILFNLGAVHFTLICWTYILKGKKHNFIKIRFIGPKVYSFHDIYLRIRRLLFLPLPWILALIFTYLHKNASLNSFLSLLKSYIDHLDVSTAWIIFAFAISIYALFFVARIERLRARKEAIKGADAELLPLASELDRLDRTISTYIKRFAHQRCETLNQLIMKATENKYGWCAVRGVRLKEKGLVACTSGLIFDNELGFGLVGYISEKPLAKDELLQCLNDVIDRSNSIVKKGFAIPCRTKMRPRYLEIFLLNLFSYPLLDMNSSPYSDLLRYIDVDYIKNLDSLQTFSSNVEDKEKYERDLVDWVYKYLQELDNRIAKLVIIQSQVTRVVDYLYDQIFQISLGQRFFDALKG